MGLESTVTIFPLDPNHRLVGADLTTFLDRVSERLIALGDGARARVRAGRFDGEARTFLDLIDTVAAARGQAQGREDLEIRLWGPARDHFSRFLGTSTLDIKFQAFVEPHLLLDASLCQACGWPLDYDGIRGESSCGRTPCGDDVAQPGELWTCWWLRFFGNGPDGIGERFVVEGRRLEGSRYLEALEGASRVRLLEWQAWA